VAAPVAGTTRDVLREPLELPSGQSVMLVDAPGLEPSRNELDVLVQQRAEEALHHADVLLWCSPVDHASQPAPKVRARVLAVGTMCDRASALDSSRPAAEIRTSARTRQGLDALRAAIDGELQCNASLSTAEQHALGNAQQDLTAQAIHALLEAARIAGTAPAGARQMPHPELVAASLRTALDRLGEVAGAIPPDDVLARLFSRFCVGK
jgi:tRNA modification GTPase